MTYKEREILGGLATDLETRRDLPFQFLVKTRSLLKCPREVIMQHLPQHFQESMLLLPNTTATSILVHVTLFTEEVLSYIAVKCFPLTLTHWF